MSTNWWNIKWLIKERGCFAGYGKIRFTTCTHPLFSEYHQLFYDGKKKPVPFKLDQLFTTPLSLAVWYLDDGGLRPDYKAFRFHTNNFSLEEVHLLQDILWKNFQLKTTTHPQGKGYIIHMGARGGEGEKCCKLIPPLVASIVPDMLYKFYQPCNDWGNHLLLDENHSLTEKRCQDGRRGDESTRWGFHTSYIVRGWQYPACFGGCEGVGKIPYLSHRPCKRSNPHNTPDARISSVRDDDIVYSQGNLGSKCIASWSWRRFQGFGCSPMKAVRELGLVRWETVRILSFSGDKKRGEFPSDGEGGATKRLHY